MRLAAGRGTTPSAELFAAGLDPELYYAWLAADLGVGFAADLAGARPVRRGDDSVPAHANAALVRLGKDVLHVIAPRPDEIGPLRSRLRAEPRLVRRIRVASPRTIRTALVTREHEALAIRSVRRLAAELPPLSAQHLGRRRGAEGTVALSAAALAMALVAPAATFATAALLLTLFFYNCAVWKLAAAFGRQRPLRLERVPDSKLPTYTLLVPLYQEADIVEDLIRHLGGLDYPTAKLQVLIVLEADDRASRAAIDREKLPPHFETIVVPPVGPRTKPKALTYALAFARGDIVVVFDAEDRPEPDQLRKAAAAFRERPDLGCVQARLIPDNRGTWLARMFTIEYAANFEVLLPGLARLGVPLPLGGTSNHFPRSILERVGGWDPYNVTEDADLGIRLARFGYPTATIFARTYEEAPIRLNQWLPQRRRWVKGWMQTVVLSLGNRIPPRLRLPLRQQLALHGVLSAGVLGLLLYPLSLAVLTWTLLAALRGEWPAGAFAWSLLLMNLGNAVAVLTAAIVSSLRGLAAIGALRLAFHLPLLPVYWALMSLAAWQALIRYYSRPSEWEKTRHGVARDRRALRCSELRL